MLQATYVRPDRIARTAVLDPTAEGYQPVLTAQDVAAQFTQIYGPTVYGGATGLGCACRGLGAAKQSLWSRLYNRAQGLVMRVIPRPTYGITLKPTVTAQAAPPASTPATVAVDIASGGAARPGAIPTTYGVAPSFNRQAQAANKIVPAASQPPSVYLPARQGGLRVNPAALTAEALAWHAVTGVPAKVKIRGQANALDWFHRTGRYY